ncbi:MAG: phosphoribosylformylglycinamidine cyclo-ligase [Actinobacteria bacterium]|nr:phosphoribosylformylglycinamidine cyclo-ligase [Actinomycetota bacterium]
MSEISYSAAGVDIEAGDRAVALMKASIAKATRPEVMGGIGGFAGLFDASKLRNYAKPLLATSTDGVGTKTEIARRTGFDLVVCGAEPLFMTDYIAVGKVVPETIARIVAGIADGCAIAGCALIGGETAEHPGLMAPDEFDIAGAATGVVDEPRLLGAHLVKEGDVLIAMASSGLHANGFSLVRHILATHSIDLEATHPDLPATWGELLATPTQIYAKPALALAALPGTHAMAHITGGGLAANTARSIPAGLQAVLDRATWNLPPIFATLSQIAGLPQAEMEKTWNVGVGMVAAVAPESLEVSLATLTSRGIHAWHSGQVSRPATKESSPGIRAPHAALVGKYRNR